jgi:hypothetical protein
MRISRLTALCPALMPWPGTRPACTRGAPYVPREAWWKVPGHVCRPGVPDCPEGERPGRPGRSILAAAPPAHGRSAPSAPRHRGVRRLGGSGLWGHHCLHRGRRPAQDLHFFLKVADPPPCRSQPGAFLGRGAGFQAASTRSRCRHRYKHDPAIPGDAATSRILRLTWPDPEPGGRTGGYGLGIANCRGVPVRS